MIQLRNSLLRLGKLNTALAEATSRKDEGRNAVIISLRQSFTEECGFFLVNLQALLRYEELDLFERLQDEFEDMRSKLSGHQAKWTIAEINRNHPAYIADKHSVYSMIERFVRESVEAIASLVALEEQQMQGGNGPLVSDKLIHPVLKYSTMGNHAQQ